MSIEFNEILLSRCVRERCMSWA